MAYARLVEATRSTVKQAQRVEQALQGEVREASQKLARQMAVLLPRLEQFIEQTTRRVFAGEAVPASEKGVSLFEPHTAIIRKGKPGRPVQFGRVVWP